MTSNIDVFSVVRRVCRPSVHRESRGSTRRGHRIFIYEARQWTPKACNVQTTSRTTTACARRSRPISPRTSPERGSLAPCSPSNRRDSHSTAVQISGERFSIMGDTDADSATRRDPLHHIGAVRSDLDDRWRTTTIGAHEGKRVFQSAESTRHGGLWAGQLPILSDQSEVVAGLFRSDGIAGHMPLLELPIFRPCEMWRRTPYEIERGRHIRVYESRMKSSPGFLF